MKTKNCAQCGKEFEYKLETAKYCSGTCRARASVLNGTQPIKETDAEEQTPAKAPVITTPRNYDPSGTIISPQAQFMISQLEKESARWERLYEEEKDKKGKAKKELEKITKELAELQKNIAIDDATAPSGLHGIMESQGFKELAPFLGPVLQKLGERILLPASNAPITGTEDTPTESPIAQIATWFNSLGESTKGQVLDFMQFLSTQDETSVARIMAQIRASGFMGYSRAM